MLIYFGLAFWNRKLTKKKKKRLECGNWCSGIYSLDLPFGIEFYFFKKISGNMLVAFVSASVVWFCFSEHKIKHTKKKKKKDQNVEIGLLVWFGFAFWNRNFKKKNCGNMLVSLVSASLVWSCLLEYKINQNKKRSERGNWPSSLVWLCLLE